MKNFAALKLRRNFSYKMFLNVFAEEPNTPPTPPTGDPEPPKADPKPSGTVNFEELISKARKEERDKLYSDINKHREKANNLLLVVQERDNEITTLKAEVEKLRGDYSKVSDELKTGVKTNKTVSELTATISGLERQLEDLQIQYETDVNSLKLDSFKREKVAEVGGELIPELVTGNTEEEILASIETAKQRYAEITQRALNGVQMPRVNPSATQIQLKDISMDDISKMTPQEWAKHRAELGLK
jgi:archaellum component FlaC